MTDRTPASNAVALDLQAYSTTLANLLSALLFSRDREALTRWTAVRSWVDNALAGDDAPAMTTIAIAVAYLEERADEQSPRQPRRPARHHPGDSTQS